MSDEQRSQIRVQRPFYTQQDFYKAYQTSAGAKTNPFVKGIRSYWARECYQPPSRKCAKFTLHSFLPIIKTLRDYKFPSDFVADLMSGLVVGFMQVPQGMAYGMQANVDAVHGLYSSFFPVVLYCIFGTSKHISLGLFPVVSMMVGEVVSSSDCFAVEANASSSAVDDESSMVNSLPCRIEVAVALAFIVGLYQIILGLLRFGFLTIYLSDPLTSALTWAAAVHVVTGQLKLAFQVDMGKYSGTLKLIYNYIALFKNIKSTNVASLVIFIVCSVAIFIFNTWINPRVRKKIKTQIPIELLCGFGLFLLFIVQMIVGTFISYYLTFKKRFGVHIVGVIPPGIPVPRFPPSSRFLSVAKPALGITIVTYTLNIALSKPLAKKYGYSIDANQEWFAYGAGNLVSSMLNCICSCGSMSRTSVLDSTGGRTQITGLVSAIVVLGILLLFGPLLHDLPQSILAAVVIVNLKGTLMNITDIKTLYHRAQYFDLVIWLVTGFSVLLSEVDIGLYISISFALLSVIFRTQRPEALLLGRIPHTDIYECYKLYSLAVEINGIKIFRFTSSIYYANAEYYARQLYTVVGCDPIEIKRQLSLRNELESKRKKTMKKRAMISDSQAVVEVEDDKSAVQPKLCDIHSIIMDFSAVNFIDTVGINTVNQVLQEYFDIGVRVLLACCQETIYSQLERTGTFQKYTAFYAVHDAVLSAAESNPKLHRQLRRDSTFIVNSILSKEVADAEDNV